MQDGEGDSEETQSMQHKERSNDSQILSLSSINNIASAVSSAVVASLRPLKSSTNTSLSMVQERPLVVAEEAGEGDLVQGPVTSALDNLLGELCQLRATSTSTNLLKFNSVSIPIDAQIDSKEEI